MGRSTRAVSRKPQGLRRTLALNGKDTDFIKIELADLANDTVYTSPTGRQDGCGVASLNTLESEAFVVETIHVDALADDGEILPPTAVKIDVEGAELRVLECMDDALSWIRVRYVLCEVHGPSDHRSSMEDFGDLKAVLKKYLRRRGFHVSTIAKGGFEHYVLSELGDTPGGTIIRSRSSILEKYLLSSR